MGGCMNLFVNSTLKSVRHTVFVLATVMLFAGTAHKALAQTSEDPAASSVDINSAYTPSEPLPEAASKDIDQIESEIESKAKKENRQVEQKQSATPNKLEDFSGLGRLAPFSEVSVIQRRFLPKTGRFQFFAGLTGIMNDPWYFSGGGDARLSYNFTEAWGLELQADAISNSQREAIKELHDENGVNTDSIITSKAYYGGAIVWSPIYGKMGMLNRRIVPFDMYFSVGGGTTKVDNGTGGSTIHLGTGQVYGINKGFGLRWDFTWNMVSAKPTNGTDQTFNNILLSFGASFFFPEASYR